MREARIIFPVTGPLNAAVQSGIEQITHAFGGATVYQAMGSWKAPNGEFLHEAVRIADIAYEPSTENDAKLYDIAWEFRQAANQVEVYLRYGNGNVQMVTEKSCMDNGEVGFDFHKLMIDLHAIEDIERETVSDIAHAEHVEI